VVTVGAGAAFAWSSSRLWAESASCAVSSSRFRRSSISRFCSSSARFCSSTSFARAGRAAGCQVFCVPYGYNEGGDVHELDCDRLVDSLEEAAAWVARSKAE